MTPHKTFTAARAIVLEPIHPGGRERSRVFAHPNAAPVWERARRF
ncbi:hypothetical protein [Oricola cellulosilytica]|nr:hypothetical protein [Oricola cellulosilytica]